MSAGRAIGGAFVSARDILARGLVRLGVRPNAITLLGFAFTAAGGVLLARGAGDYAAGWNFWAAGMLILSGATDMLDGAVARIGHSASTFGAFLDSTLDRFSDFAIFAGLAFYFAWRGNVTLTLLAMLSINHAFAISYTRARAEDLIPRCRVGYWQRGERFAAVLIALFARNIPALLWQQAISPAFTVWRRIHYTWRVAHGRKTAEHPRDGSWWDRVQLWRWPRGSWPYDFITAANIAFLIFAPLGDTDLIRAWLT